MISALSCGISSASEARSSLSRRTSRRSDRIAACLAALEHEYVTTVDDGEPRFLPVASKRTAPFRVKVPAGPGSAEGCPGTVRTHPDE